MTSACWAVQAATDSAAAAAVATLRAHALFHPHLTRTYPLAAVSHRQPVGRQQQARPKTGARRLCAVDAAGSAHRHLSVDVAGTLDIVAGGQWQAERAGVHRVRAGCIS